MTPYRRHWNRWKDCTACPLHLQRNRVVLARGKVPAEVVFIGEAPGPSEDVIGKPFVGPAGKDRGCGLDHLIEVVLGQRYSYAITNLVACFPREAKRAGVNEPPAEAVWACAPRLREFVRLCKPRLVVLVGKLASQYIQGAAQFRLDDRPEQPEWVPLEGELLFCEIIHPAAILRLDISQRGLAAQRAVVTLSDAVEEI